MSRDAGEFRIFHIFFVPRGALRMSRRHLEKWEKNPASTRDKRVAFQGWGLTSKAREKSADQGSLTYCYVLIQRCYNDASSAVTFTPNLPLPQVCSYHPHIVVSLQ